MVDAICSVEGCGRPVKCRGWCSSHYKRAYRTGDTRGDVPIGTPTARRHRGAVLPFPENVLRRLVFARDGHVVWSGVPTKDGYGAVWVRREYEMVHRVVWGWLRGRIPSGAEMVNRCGVRACCAPAHWEVRERSAA